MSPGDQVGDTLLWQFDCDQHFAITEPRVLKRPKRRPKSNTKACQTLVEFITIPRRTKSTLQLCERRRGALWHQTFGSLKSSLCMKCPSVRVVRCATVNGECQGLIGSRNELILQGVPTVRQHERLVDYEASDRSIAGAHKLLGGGLSHL